MASSLEMYSKFALANQFCSATFWKMANCRLLFQALHIRTHIIYKFSKCYTTIHGAYLYLHRSSRIYFKIINKVFQHIQSTFLNNSNHRLHTILHMYILTYLCTYVRTYIILWMHHLVNRNCEHKNYST